MTETTVAVPCYNEADRLPADQFLEFSDRNPDVGFVFVNDGSRDATLDVLERLVAHDPKRLHLVDQQPNRGKAEAVRVGVNFALERESRFVGFLDADLSTPLVELPRLRDVLLEHPACMLAMGARVQLLGRHIRRSATRHYLGRVFATVASMTLDVPVYDTQCGAKLFRSSPLITECFTTPFVSTWIFDVELIARMIAGRRDSALPPIEELIYEVPLNTWRDVAGSKLKPSDFMRSILEMWRIHRRYLSGRRS